MDRWADGFIFTMDAADPAAWAADAFVEFADCSSNVLGPRGVFFDKRYPADPLVPGQRGQTLPSNSCFGRGQERLFEIPRQPVRRPARQ